MPEILSFQETSERLAARRKNTRLLIVHWSLAVVLYIALAYVFMRERGSDPLFVIIVDFFIAHILAAVLLAVPSLRLSGFEYPEIILLDDRLVYVGGSKALWYPSYWRMFITHLLGVERSTVVKKKDILSTGIERPRFLGAGAGLFKCFRISHADGEIHFCVYGQESIVNHVRDKVEEWVLTNCS